MICSTKCDEELCLTAYQFITAVHLNIIIKQSTLIIATRALPILINFSPRQFLFHIRLQGVVLLLLTLNPLELQLKFLQTMRN